MSSPTPRTDLARHGFVQANPLKTDIDMWGIPCVDADFASQLERELQQAHAAHAETIRVANEEMDRHKRQMSATQEDVERLDYLDRIVKDGACPGLINDDAGHWAVSHCGIQNVPDSTPADISTTFFVMASEWKNSVREAIDADMSAAQTGDPS